MPGVNETGISLKGMELGMAARPGESYDEYKSRLLRAKRDVAGGAGTVRSSEPSHRALALDAMHDGDLGPALLR